MNFLGVRRRVSSASAGSRARAGLSRVRGLAPVHRASPYPPQEFFSVLESRAFLRSRSIRVYPRHPRLQLLLSYPRSSAAIRGSPCCSIRGPPRFAPVLIRGSIRGTNGLGGGQGHFREAEGDRCTVDTNVQRVREERRRRTE